MTKFVYLDTSAAAKLFVEEIDSAAFRQWVSARQDFRYITSDLTRTELRRAMLIGQIDEATWEDVESWISRSALIRLTAGLCDEAGVISARGGLRSLDAIHTAAAQSVRSSLEALVTYDKRLASAASAWGLPVAMPTDA